MDIDEGGLVDCNRGMEVITVLFKKLSDRGICPTKATPFSAGYDLYNAERVNLAQGRTSRVKTGISISIPCGFCGLILPRSGISLRFPNYIVNSPGLIDSDYRGEIEIAVINRSSVENLWFHAGERIAQLVIIEHKAPFIEFVESLELSKTERSTGGFGSTGV